MEILMTPDNHQQKTQQFDNYLTDHLDYTIDPQSRIKKKQRLQYNYQKLLPGNLNAKILEVGPGHGELLEFLIKDQKYQNVIGVDISSEVVNFCNELIPESTKLLSGDDQYFKENQNLFDCIMMLHVLEHVPKNQTISLLTHLHNCLKPGGLMIVEVPNMANPIVGLNFRYADFTHEVGFTDASLKYVLRRAGFFEIAIRPSIVPTISVARKMQYFLQLSLEIVLSLVMKIYIPSSKQIISTAIYAVSIKK
jgi:2-polyprenyl-3-methyl-5-hydroxy-6-metoxy-1,4-benzoquinol methylase